MNQNTFATQVHGETYFAQALQSSALLKSQN